MDILPAQKVIEQYNDGDENGWEIELAYLWKVRRPQLLNLMDSVLAEGFREPIDLGCDGRVWDGHHRIAVALALGISLPVHYPRVAFG